MRGEYQRTGVGTAHPNRTGEAACHPFKILRDACHYLFPLSERCVPGSPFAFLCSLHSAVMAIPEDGFSV